MPEPTTSPYLTVATALQAIIAAEFEDEQFTAIRDRIHESLGRERVDIGIAPDEEYPRENNALMQETYVEIRFYGLWDQTIAPDTVVDPAIITGYAERLRKAIFASEARDPATDEVWFFDVRRCTYPNDPTGNKTRFHMQIRAFGANSGLVETTA